MKARVVPRRMLLACAALLVARQLPAQTAARVVIRAADIEAAGWQRINEILDVVPGWRVTSTDGFTYTPSSDGLPAVGASGPSITLAGVYVNDERIPVQLFGVQELEFVPVLLAQVDSIVLSSEPQFVSGRIEVRGAIRFYTRKPPAGITARGEFQVGDVANKPGLYWHTPMSPPNREHIGPFEHLLIGVGGARVGLDVGVRYATLNTTDTLILRRRPPFPGTAATTQINLPAPVAHLDVTGLGGHHVVDATRAHYSGLFFIPAFGHEQSLRMDASTVAASGSVRAGAGLGIRYSAGYTSDDVTALPSQYPSTVLHHRRNAEGMLELSHAIGRMRGGIGGAGQRWMLSGGGMRGARTETRAFAHLDGITTGPLTSSIAAVLTHSVHANALGGSLLTEWRPSGVDDVRLTAASTSEDPQGDGRWIDSTVLAVHSGSMPRRISTADLSWSRGLGYSIALLTSVGASRVSAWPAAVPSDTGFFEAGGVEPPPTVPGDLDVFRAKVGLETARHPRWYGRLLYSYAAPIGGDSTLRTTARSIARHQVNGQAWVVPARDWRVMTLVQMVSSSYWAAFPRLATGWPPTVAGFARIDLGVEKWMWSRHVRFQYQVRDVFNRSERWHPRSSEYNLRWLASASFVVGAHD